MKVVLNVNAIDMRIDPSKKIRTVAGENILIKQASGTADMTSVVALNESALELFNQLQGHEFTLDDVVRTLTDTYEVDEATARTDAQAWVDQMRKEGLILG